MKIMRLFFALSASVLLLTACTSSSGSISRKAAYPEMYRAPLTTLLIMPPINETNKVEAKEFFFTTLSQPLCEKGYYVIPPYVSMEVYKSESAYDADLTINRPLDKFANYFGADMILFTIIHKWEKAALAGTISVNVEYIVKSPKTNAVIYSRRGDVTLDASVGGSGGGLFGALVNLAATAIATASTPHVKAARACNAFSFSDFPSGKYSPTYLTDSVSLAGKKIFKANVKPGQY